MKRVTIARATAEAAGDAAQDALAAIMERLHPRLRREFPALGRNIAGGCRVYLNNAGGTIVCERSARMMARTALFANPQDGDITLGERATAELHQAARAAVADFLNAPAAAEVTFHLSATHALFNLAIALRHHLVRGDNIVVTGLDHAANVSPWESLFGADRGLEIRPCRMRRDGTLDLDHLAGLVDARTRVVAVTRASNALGSIVPIEAVARIAHRNGVPRPPARPGRPWNGALVVVDAVHYAPHGPIDVRALGCDLLVFSGYKVFGPMTGVLWGRRVWLEALRPYRVEPNANRAPVKFEQGTPNHAVLMGLAAAIGYLAWLGGQVEEAATSVAPLRPLARTLRRLRYDPARRRLKWAMLAIAAWEERLSAEVIAGWRRDLAPLGVRLHGVADPRRLSDRVPTFLFEIPGRTQEEVKRALWRRSRIEVPSGNYYAPAVYRHLKSRRTIRASFAHYDTPATARLFVRALRSVAGGTGRRTPQRAAVGARGRPRPVAR